MKYALIGCGRIATNHVKAVVNNNLEFVAACDLIPQAIESLLAKHGLENDKTIARYTDYKLMLKEHPEIQTAFIITDYEVNYRAMAKELHIKYTYQLYRDYLDNFRINHGRS